MAVRLLVRVAVLAALAAVLMLFETRLPLFPDFLKYDFSDLPALLAAFTMGPLTGVGVEFLKELMFLATGRATSGLVGVAANFVAGGTLVLVAGSVHRAGDGLPGWVRGGGALVAGSAAMAAIMIPANALIFLPLWGIPASDVWAFSMTIVPFNLVKGTLSTALGLALYRRLEPLLSHRLQRAA